MCFSPGLGVAGKPRGDSVSVWGIPEVVSRAKHRLPACFWRDRSGPAERFFRMADTGVTRRMHHCFATVAQPGAVYDHRAIQDGGPRGAARSSASR